MLKSLSIKNYALIEQLQVDFTGGLVIITGETGAGKSIIVDSLGLILGGRASTEAVRTGAEKAIVEAVFDVTGNRKLTALLIDNELDSSEELILRREVSAKGQSRSFVNDSPVTGAFQKQVGELLVDLHGQHEHQSLLRPSTHIEMLDEFGGLDGMVEEFRAARAELDASAEKLHDLKLRELQLREKREFHEFQIQEIDAVGPRAGEEDELETELRILENAERLSTATTRLYESLYEGEQSIHDLLVVVRNQLNSLGEIDTQFQAAAEETASALAVVSELAKFIQGYNARVESNPERLEHIRERLGRLAYLKKKYGGDIESILEHRNRIGEEVRLADSFESVIATLSTETEEARNRCAVIARRLSVKRQETARKIDKAIVAELAKLGIVNGRFAARIARGELREAPDREENSRLQFVMDGRKRIVLSGRGWDAVEFFISTNLGEDVKPLVKVASGGEISRIMLALKTILAKSDRLPVLIFDEIDVGVSGRIAQAVGLSLKSLSEFHQVVAITHLPQIAGLADSHFVVQKVEDGERASTSIRRLSQSERVLEVAKLMSGAEVTEAGLEGARELMSIGKGTR